MDVGRAGPAAAGGGLWGQHRAETIVDGGAAAPCMTVGDDGAARVVYWARGELRSATQVPGGWALRTVARASPVTRCSMAIDGRGLIRVAYLEDRQGEDQDEIRHGFRDCRGP